VPSSSARTSLRAGRGDVRHAAGEVRPPLPGTPPPPSRPLGVEPAEPVVSRCHPSRRPSRWSLARSPGMVREGGRDSFATGVRRGPEVSPSARAGWGCPRPGVTPFSQQRPRHGRPRLRERLQLPYRVGETVSGSPGRPARRTPAPAAAGPRADRGATIRGARGGPCPGPLIKPAHGLVAVRLDPSAATRDWATACRTSSQQRREQLVRPASAAGGPAGCPGRANRSKTGAGMPAASAAAWRERPGADEGDDLEFGPRGVS